MSKVWYGSLQNRIFERIVSNNFNVGDVMTMISYTDRQIWYVKSIDKVSKNGEVKVMTLIRPKTFAIDYYAGKWKVQSFEDTITGRPLVREDDGYVLDYPNEELTVMRTSRGTFSCSGKVDDTVFVSGNYGEYEDPTF